MKKILSWCCSPRSVWQWTTCKTETKTRQVHAFIQLPFILCGRESFSGKLNESGEGEWERESEIEFRRDAEEKLLWMNLLLLFTQEEGTGRRWGNIVPELVISSKRLVIVFSSPEKKNIKFNLIYFQSSLVLSCKSHDSDFPRPDPILLRDFSYGLTIVGSTYNLIRILFLTETIKNFSLLKCNVASPEEDRTSDGHV